MSKSKSLSRQAGPTASGGASARPGSSKLQKLQVPPILFEGDEPPQSTEPVQKYALSPVHAGIGQGGHVELPEAYGTGKLGIIARDPRCIYVFWDVTPKQQESYFAGSEKTDLVLRVEDKASGKQVAEVQADLRSRSWFVAVPRGGAAYRANLGFAPPGRGWISIAVSEVIKTPSEGISPNREARFAEVRAPQMVTATISQRSGGIDEFGAETMPGSASLSETLSQTEQAEFDLGLPPIESWSPAQEHALEKIINFEQIRREWIGSLEIAELVARGRLEGELGSLMGPLQPRDWPISSPFGGQPAGPRQFWFNLNAELIVYGATEPNARVTLAGREVQLRPDGTFSYRFALPDGFYELRAEAKSIENEMQAAVLRFMRQTEYQADVGEHPQDPRLKPPPG